ncbi:MAG: MOSC domain-containing protein [Actinomycetota bacterium]
MSDATVARINVTPLKSAALHHPRRVRIEPWGVAGNRAYFLVREDGRLWNGTKQGSLVRLRADLDGDRLAVAFPDGTRVEAVAAATGEALVTDFYGRPVPGHVVPGPWDGPLSAFAGTPLRLVAPDEPGGASDVRPLTLDARRFRMTFDLDGCTAYEEDSWAGRVVALGGATVRVLGAVPRCVVTTLDPSTGERDFPTLSAIKRARGVVDGDLPFGVYAEILEPGDVAVGDAVVPR